MGLELLIRWDRQEELVEATVSERMPQLDAPR
jgi:hypothetical protein